VSTVIDLRTFTNTVAVPVMVFVDLQQEYVAAPRALALGEVSRELANCREILAHARSAGLPIAFTRWIGKSPFFNAATRFSDWIKGFEPHNTDMIFDRSQPSCYSNNDFAEVIANGGGNLVIAGFAGEVACLSTAIDAFHRGHNLMFVSDASASHALAGTSARDVHNFITRLVSLYGEVTTTQSWIEDTSPGALARRGFS
jgi:nicotinamidase-related amidase